MATIAKFLESGATLADFNDGTSADLLEYNPRSPVLLDSGRYDLVTPIQDAMTVAVRGTTRDAVANAASLLEEKCFNLNQNRSKYYEIAWRANNLTTQGNANLHAANLERLTPIYPDITNVYRQNVKVNLTRSPVWLGTFQSITLDAGTPVMDNDDTGYIILPVLLGDLPAFTKLTLSSTGGNTASVKRVLAGLKTFNAANFVHILQAESATTLDGALTNLSSTNYSPGGAGVTAKSWNPTSGNTSFRSLMRWDITTNLESYRDTFLLLLRVADLSPLQNYRFRGRGGDIVSGNYIAGAWGTAERIRTQVQIAAPTTEFTLLSLGLITLPRYSGRNMPRDGVFVEIYGEGLAASAGAVYLDNVFLIPVSMGTLAAEFDLSLSSRNAVLDSREGFNPAYLEAAGAFLAASASVPQGSGIFLYPRLDGQRVFFIVTRNEAEFFKHDRSNSLTLTASYQPRFCNMPGTN